MDRVTQEKHFESFITQMREIMLKKGNDYSNTDRLSNFKLGGAIIGLSAEMQALALISTKVARLGNLLQTQREPNYESLRDTLIDLANYAILLDMIVEDTKAQPMLMGEDKS